MILHILVIAIQLIGVFVPFVGCICLLKQAKNRTSMYLLLANLGCLIINGSYLLLLQTQTHEGALISLKMEYFGNVVFYLMFGLFLWSYLGLKRHRWTKIVLSLWSAMEVLFLLCIWVTNGFPLVFETLQFDRIERFGLVLVQITPGVLYMIRYCLICMFLLYFMIYTIVRIFSVPIASERNNLIKVGASQFVIVASLTLMILFNFSFDIVPLCASTSILSIIVSAFRNEFFGITELGQQWVFEQMEDAFIITDEMYGYLDSNLYAKKIFPELNYKRRNETVAGDMFRLFTNDEKVVQVYGKFYNKKITEIRDKGTVSGYSMLLVDITEQHELMERVKEEKERADAANQAKSAFVSNVSHEIRTPMNAIVGMTQIMLRQNDLSGQNREYLKNIQNSGNALLTLINDLLDMSKIESGKMELVDEEYDFMSMLSDLGMIILNRIGNKPVELLFDIDPDIPAKLYGDALRIRQIIINLMNNATKFTESGYVRLTVKVNQIQEKDIELFISVQDTGQGIREEDLNKLFGTFQQVDTKKNHHKEGTGLGLSISKQLVELMHGNIGVTSEYGKGSEFYFTIHQQVASEEKAARITEGRQAAVAGSLENAEANELLRKLVGYYHLAYVEDILSFEQPELPLYYITDRYKQLDEEIKQTLESLNATVCSMTNPMAENSLPENASPKGGFSENASLEDAPLKDASLENDFSKNVLTMNKPLYCYNFCNLIENRLNKDADAMKDDMASSSGGFQATGGNSAQDSACSINSINTNSMEFTAPQARILIVDDNEINCMVAEEMLKPLKLQIDLASDGKQALEMIQKTTYDLVFMDHLMPVMNGLEAVEALRKSESDYCKNLPVIALTGNTGKDQQEEYFRAGMSDYLSKPIDMTEIYHKIRKWIPDKIRESIE
ncbi:MAG: ATP-binding protein [Lachnoclostridium sp.]|nr:ATP-binding protein [Lachnospira sp.]MCM1248669.1 ATP-binding protein [Lachnoclostridium sp.]MCM1536156.1 ATP-binding protein [Clostridium sp.]